MTIKHAIVVTNSPNYLVFKIFTKKAKVDPKLCRFLAPLLARSCSPRVWRLLSQIKLRKRSRKGKKPLKKINIYLQFLTCFKFYLDLIKIEFSLQTLSQNAFVGEELKSVLKMAKLLAERVFRWFLNRTTQGLNWK